MRAKACAVLLAFVCGACATSGPSTAGHHGTKAEAHKRSAGVARIRASFDGGPLEPKTHRGMLDNKPVRNVRISVVCSDGTRWHGRTSGEGTRTFKLWPGPYVITSDWSRARRTLIKMLPERVLPVRYACLVR